MRCGGGACCSERDFDDAIFEGVIGQDEKASADSESRQSVVDCPSKNREFSVHFDAQRLENSFRGVPGIL
jgi:hypothetical protein